MPQSWDMGDRFFYFPSGGRRTEDFYARKNPTASAGFEPANLGTIWDVCIRILTGLSLYMLHPRLI